MAKPSADEIIKWAKSKLGSHKWDKRCQAFVADAYSVGGKYVRNSKGTATQAYKAWCKSKSSADVPAGAAVYFDGTKSAVGHVGIYIGQGQYIHASQGIRISNLSGATGYRGWGFNGNVTPSGVVVSEDDKGSGSDSAGSGAGASSQDKEITSMVVKSVSGTQGKRKPAALLSEDVLAMNDGVQILIQNDKIYNPIIEGDVTLEFERKGSPGSLKFNVVKDNGLNIQEGNPVSLKIDGTGVFYGYIFTKARTDKKIISVTCYDQLRYLKNKDTFVHKGFTYSDLLKQIAADYGLPCGEVQDTKYVLPGRVEEDTLMDILANAADLTVVNTANLFVLYDDFGKLTLKNIQDMKLPLLIDEDVAVEYSYSSSIDKNVYNKIKLARDDSEQGARDTFVVNDQVSQESWGILQYYEKSNKATAAELQERAKTLLKYNNKKQRTLSVNKCLGDIRVRGGSSLVVNLELGDIIAQNYMVVEKVKHTFSQGQHFMDLSLSGVRGEFNV